MIQRLLLRAIFFAIPLAVSASCFCQDWPQWMGPSRDNVWHAASVLDRFPADGPPVLWSVPISNGYSGPAVAGNRVYLTDFVTESDLELSNFDRTPMPGTERVHCFEAGTGRQLWMHQSDVTYAISYPNGPRATPLVDEDRLYTLGGEGNLVCFHRETGRVIWSRQLKEDYRTTAPLWGYASHPMIDGERLICVAGGAGSHTVALDKMTGTEIWRYGTASEQGYCPVNIVDIAGVRQMLILSPDWIASIDPATGKEWWRQQYQADNGSIIMTPTVIADQYLFVGGFNKRNLLLELDLQQPGATPLLRDRTKELMSPVNVQPFVIDNVMYGMDADGTLMAVEIPSGRRLWETGQPIAARPVRSGTAFIVQHQDRFFLFTENGDLVICRLNPDGYEEIDRCHVIEPTNRAAGRPVVWSAPAFAGTRMFARNDRQLICLELKQ
jgi:outer membrane protein assembly factor BamB